MTRVCEGCGVEITRSPGTGQRDWLRKRFCTAGCRVASGNAWIGSRDNGYQDAPDTIALATRNLGVACMELFERTARQRNITVQQAARAHLCGAS